MPQQATSTRYTLGELKPKYKGIFAMEEAINLQPSTTYVAGQLLAHVATATNDVQTLTLTGSPTGGTFTLTGTNPLSGLNFTSATIANDASAATLQTELRKVANFGPSGVTVTGSAGGPWTLTFAGGGLSGVPIPILVLGTNALTGGTAPSLTIAHTTTGRTAGTYGKYTGSPVAVPAAPTVSGTGSGSGWGAGTHLVSVTSVTAAGETTPSIPAKITLTAAQLIRVAAITGLADGVTAVNIYVDGVLLAQAAVSANASAQTDVDNVSLTLAGVAPPAVNTAYGAGVGVPACLNKYGCQTDAAGNIAYSTTNTVGEWGEARMDTPAYFSGIFSTADLTGLDARAVASLGRLWNGTISAGELRVN